MKFASFAEFYPFYLSEHSKRWTRIFHFVGLSFAMGFIAVSAIERQACWLLAAFVSGYGPAFASHFLFEKNRPATLKNPFYSFLSDWRMYFDLLTGKQRF